MKKEVRRHDIFEFAQIHYIYRKLSCAWLLELPYGLCLTICHSFGWAFDPGQSFSHQKKIKHSRLFMRIGWWYYVSADIKLSFLHHMLLVLKVLIYTFSHALKPCADKQSGSYQYFFAQFVQMGVSSKIKHLHFFLSTNLLLAFCWFPFFIDKRRIARATL